MNPYANPFARPPQSLAGRIVAFILTGALLVLAFMFSLVALAVAAVGGVIFAGWFWWKTRALRKAMRAAAPVGAAGPVPGGDFIDGECVREVADDRLLR
ncbi:hypothetical protein DFR40_3156 [Azonexus fungiphilus]|jgi:hypothetical protein|uniref:Uncharacterized protein n=1 Tax=Azonexus fungiphilus TaxID=146940 RepID=A0A495VNM8_9RHOO|nr:hypothetical protein [Azonexus fungiphilus]NHC07410.1 hypothetical protein [Azonexus fungiphilus]RKT50013.1 hypothetical protein DFR40_3156 [Azonexus fungiphilus]